MSTSLMATDKGESKKKGMFAAGALGGSVLLFVGGWPIMGTAALGGAAFLGYKWFMFRAKRGMRF